MRCGAPLSYVRKLLSAEDATAFVFLSPSGLDVPQADEGRVTVGQMAPRLGDKTSKGGLPPLPDSSNQGPQTDEAGDEKPKKQRRKLGKDFTTEDIRLAVEFMDKNGDGEISFKELEDAFRKSRRTKADAKLQAKGKRSLNRIKDLIRSAEMTVHEWFELMDSSGAAESNGSISTMEVSRVTRGGLSFGRLFALTQSST